MIDFANMGTILGARAAIAQVVADGEQTIAEKDATIESYRSALMVEQLHSSGLKAQVEALRAEVIRLEAANRLLRDTGRRFSDGSSESYLNQVYARGFDQAAAQRKIPNPSRFRARAG